jgi:hypothetical protein
MFHGSQATGAQPIFGATRHHVHNMGQNTLFQTLMQPQIGFGSSQWPVNSLKQPENPGKKI